MRKYSYLLSLFVALALTIVFAESSRAADPNDFRKPNQWQRERTINDAINKSSVKVEAQKTYPVSTLDQNGKPIKQMRKAKSTIKLAPSASNIGKSLFKRAPAIAITHAVIAILGKSVDWILDEQNNAVKYPVTNERWTNNLSASVYYISAKAACNAFIASNGGVYRDLEMNEYGSAARCFYSATADSAYISETSVSLYDNGTYALIPIDDVARQIQQDAIDDYAPAQEVLNDTALDMLEAGLLDAQLDAASNVPQPDPQEITQAQYDNPDYPEVGTGSGTGPETPVDPETPTDPKDPTNPEAKPFELPPFCSWASKVCDFIDWVKTEPPEPPESGEVDVQIPDSNMHEGILERLYINMPAQCPPDPILEFMGAKIPFPMSVFCQFAEMMKPLILLFAYIKGLSIIGNGLT